ncbi:MAG: ABC transporter ATP-binding protein [Bacteroidota bacterium]
MAENKIDFRLFNRVLTLSKPYKLIFIAAALLAITLAPVAVLRPRLIQTMVDEYIFQYDLGGLYYMAILFVGILVLETLMRYFFIFTTNLLGQSVVKDLRAKTFEHITQLQLSHFDRTPIGTSTTRTINDIQKINDIFAQGIMTIIADVLTLVAVLGMMFSINLKLSLICLITFPFLILATYIFKEKVKASYQVVRTQLTRMNAFLQERITGMRIVQLYNAEAQEMKRFQNINQAYTKANLNAILYYAVFFPVVEIITATALGLMVWFGAQDVLREAGVTIGVLVAFPIYLSMLVRPMRVLADKFNVVQMGLVAAQRVFNTLDNEAFIKNEGIQKVEQLQGKLHFEEVSFAYNAEDYVLKNINFELQAGKTLAIVGSTGSGKTTIISILSRFYELNKGRILVDDVDITHYELQAYRQRIAVVLQDVFLFSGSVLENITLRNQHISKEQVVEAAKVIGAHDFIMKLPGDYDYQVMERGATLSMGQRQLISFVRALVSDPDILILDEATSSIDPATEGVIQYAIEQLITKRTSIIIAHRLSTIRHADRIMVLDKGEVKEFGTHEELLEIQKGYYQKLYNMQFLKKKEQLTLVDNK